MSEKIEVGQVLFLRVKNRNEPEHIQSVTVDRIGKKYFYLIEYGEKRPIDKKTLAYTDKDYSQRNLQLYRSTQDIFDMQEKASLYDKLYKHFRFENNSSNSLEQLREAARILGIST